MEIRKGIPVSPGVAIQEAFVLDSEEFRIPLKFISGEESLREQERFQKALVDTSNEIEEMRRKVAEQVGDDYASIFGAHRQMVEDPKLKADVLKLIESQNFTPEYAVSRVLRGYVKRYKELIQDDSYFAQREADFYDVEKRLLKNLLGEKRETLKSLETSVVVIARDLSPSQTVVLDKTKVVGFATDAGGRTSHTAIIARALEIPAVVGLGTITSDVSGGDTIIIDGTRGVVIINPDEETLEKYREAEREFVDFEQRLIVELRDVPPETLDGQRISLLANIEMPEEITSVIQHGADGVGLYRTEFLYLNSEHEPTERDHFQAYLRSVQQLGSRPIVIRTLDLGADKLGASISGVRERNPFLGCRSIRYCFQNLDIFKTQIRAILRASAFGNVKILFPMICSLDELRKARMILASVMEEMREEDIGFDEDIEVGMMIEVPSAAIISDILAKEVDFFSIGTNDLVQYALAVDRVNEKVASLYNPAHTAVLRLIEMVIRNGERNNIHVGLCGEMSGDIIYAMLLLGMGLKEFSVAPAAIPEVKKIIRSVTMSEAQEVYQKVTSFDDADQTMEFLREKTKKILPGAF